MSRRSLLSSLLMIAVWLLASSPAQATNRLALVIGNGAYQHAGVLANPTNDAADVEAALQHAGFSVIRLDNASKAQMESALATFAVQASGAEMAVLFYAGHGMELNGVNYLIPVDARLESDITAPLQAIKLPDVMDIVGSSRLGIVLLDACRDNPLVSQMTRRNGGRAVYRGLARVEPMGNLQVVFAARDGSRAQDGEGRNSPFTSALLYGLKTPGLELRELWGDVREKVLADTGNKQEPYVYGTPLGRTRHYFLPPVEAKPSANVEPTFGYDPRASELAYWNAVDRNNVAALQAYINKFPQGQFADIAQIQLASITRSAPSPLQLPTPTPTPVLPEAAPVVKESGTPHGRFRDCPECPQMIRIPAGSFQMGDLSGDGRQNEKPTRTVNISAFSVGMFEVTFQEWDACVSAGGCKSKLSDKGWGRGARPVINVSWSEAQQYVKWLSGKTGRAYRLMSEAEWEYVARAGTTTAYSFGDRIDCKKARYGHSLGMCGNEQKTVPVGSYPANPWGLHDVHGNAAEWVQDCWTDSYLNAPTDGSARESQSGSCFMRVMRGGSWEAVPKALRSASRDWFLITTAPHFPGFRVAITD